MKMIVAMIKPFKLQDVVLALESVPGFPGMTVSESRGFGRTHLDGPPDRLKDLTDFNPCARVEIIVDDGLSDIVVDALLRGAHTGTDGDGILVVHALDESYSVRYGGGESEPAIGLGAQPEGKASRESCDE